MDFDLNTKNSIQNKKDFSAFIPRLKPKIVQMVLDINTELINLCKEFQNMGLVHDPEYMIYQMKLQSNLKYLSTIADYYLNPLTNEPDLSLLPIPKTVNKETTEKQKNLQDLLKKAKMEHDAYAESWKEVQTSLSKKAKHKLDEADKKRFKTIKDAYPCNRIVEALGNDRVEVNFEYLKTNDPNAYTPVSPFQLPEEVLISK
ncbi:hypothetical protein BB559_003903 [Furculomyces boomerangus]|uniref:SS18 N-terminal domain-containing protein n=2 Tax=Harpellales TaxID=61421 RepID=A0A2T9YI43_9FUNG|nr:hypothetical protein BB559_003903 [Furculomyces boomerangus]PVZ98444.1 hypothetical protein BB558_005552 [Smittium angustum]